MEETTKVLQANTERGVTRVEHCRMCGGDLKDLFSLGNHKVNDFPSTPDAEVFSCPIEIVQCTGCHLVQQRYSVQSDLLYTGKYWYKSGINDRIKKDLESIANLALVYLKPGDTILDIGANDGTLLSFIPKTYHRVGVEPADNLQEELSKHCDEVKHGFWKGYKKKAKVITAIGMFYDLEEPREFVRDIKESLQQDGRFIAQLMTAKQMNQMADVGNLCHEHLEFYNYKNLVDLFEGAGLEILSVEQTPINGGSYLIVGSHYKTGSVSHHEPEFLWSSFFERLQEQKSSTLTMLKDLKAQGKRVYGYGASTKANTMLQWWEVGTDLIEAVADANPEKHGKYMLTGIPIVSEAEARKNADYFLIFPYGFKTLFQKREWEFLVRGKFIIPFPTAHLFPK